MTEDPDFIEVAPAEAEVRAAVDADTEAKTILEMRVAAYKRLFNGADPRDVAVVMEDLTRFCRGFETTYDDIPSRQQHAEGRREVWLRIMDFTRLDPDALFLRYRKPQ